MTQFQNYKKIAFIITSIIFFTSLSYSKNILTNVYYTSLSDSFHLIIETKTKLLKYHHFELTDPLRVVIDLDNTFYPKVKKEIEVNNEIINNIKIAQFQKDIARIAIYLKRKTKYEFFESIDKTKLVVKLPLETNPQDVKDVKDVKDKKVVEIVDILLQKAKNIIQVNIIGNNPLRYKLKETPSPPSLIMTFPNTQLTLKFSKIIVDIEPLKKIILTQKGTSATIEINLSKFTQYGVSFENNQREVVLKISKEEEKKPPPVKKTINKIETTEKDDRLNVKISGSEKLLYKIKEVKTPPRVIITFDNYQSNLKENIIRINKNPLKIITIKKHKEVLDINLDLLRLTPYELSLSEDLKELTISLKVVKEIPKEKVELKKEEIAKKPEKEVIKEEKPPKDEVKEEKKVEIKKEINEIITEKLEKVIEVRITATSELKYELKESKYPPRLIVTIPNFVLNLPKKVFYIEQPPIKTIRAKQYKDKAEIDIDLTKLGEYKTSVIPDKKTLVVAFSISAVEKEIVVEEKKLPAINKLDVAKVDDKIKVTISAEEFLKYEIEEVDYPPRLDITFVGFKLNLPKETYTIDKPPLKNIIVKQLTEDKVTAAIHLIKKVEYNVNLSTDAKSVILEFVIPEELKKLYVKKEEVPKKVEIKKYVEIRDVTVKKEKDKAIIRITATDELKYKIKELIKPFKLLIEIYNAKLISPKKEIPIRLGYIKQARVYQYKTKPINIVRIVVDLKKRIDHEIVLTPDRKQLTLTAYTPIMPAVKIAKEPKVVIKKPKIEKAPLPPLRVEKLPSIPAIPKTPLVNMDFKDADIRDVLRILAKIGGINIVVAEDVPEQRITISLENVELERALDLVINTAKLAHRMFDDTLIVAKSWDTLKRIGTSVLIGDYRVETFYIGGYTSSEFKKILEKSVPEAEVVEPAGERPKDTITIVGTTATLERVRSLIKGLKKPPLIHTETFNLGFLTAEEVEKALKKAVPEAEIVDRKESPNLITIAGTEQTLKRVAEFFYKMKLLPVIEFKTIEIRDLKPDEVEKLLKKVLPGVSVVRAVAGSDSVSVTLSGRKKDLEAAEKLIQELQGGADRASIAKSIEVYKLKNFDTIEALQEVAKQDIEALLKAMVPGLEKAGKITIDKRTNSIIVRAPPADLEKVREAFAKIDVKLPQVLIEARVVDMTAAAAEIFNLSLVERLPPARKVPFQIQTTGDEAGRVTMTFNLLKKDFIVTLNSLISEGTARTLASPKVATISGKEATISLTDNIPYKIVTYERDRETGVIYPKIEWKIQEVGIKLTITPRVNEEEKIIMLKVKPEVQTVIGRIVPEQPVATNTRTVETLLRVNDGDSIVIGGLINVTERETISRIPFLAELPILGKLFTTKSKEVSDAELVIILTAHILPY